MSATGQRLNPNRVRLFRAQPYDVGTPHEETWTPEHLDQIVKNHQLLCCGESALYRPTVVVGHVRPTADGSHTAVPSYAVVGRLWREGHDLYGSFAEPSPELLSWIDGGYLRSLSVELYHEPGDANIPPHLARGAQGPMLRRVAMLGGHLPRAKGLWVAGEVAHARADQSGPYATQPGWCCGEVTAMDRDHLMQTAQQAGFSQTLLDKLDDEALASLVADLTGRMLSGGPAGGGPGATPTGDAAADAGTGAGMGDDMTQPSREQMIQDLVAAGQDQAALEQMDDTALAELWKQTQGGPAGTGGPPSTYGEGGRARSIKPLQVIQLTPRTLRQLVRAEARAEGARMAAPKRKQQVAEFCEKMVREGKLSPAQVEVDAAGKPIGPTFKLLMQASSLSRFGEGQSQSDLELLMAEIEARPPTRTYGERLASGPGGTVGGMGVDQAFEDKLKKHYDARLSRFGKG
jgi:hypothetical protein